MPVFAGAEVGPMVELLFILGAAIMFMLIDILSLTSLAAIDQIGLLQPIRDGINQFLSSTGTF